MATPAVDRTYGQRSVFGVLGQTATATAPVDDDLECEDEHDALAYLMLVRSEASKIPNVMVAPRPGPQAFPPGYAAAGQTGKKRVEKEEARRKRNKRRQRHWDDQDDGPVGGGGDDDGTGDGVKRRRTAQLSYDEVSYDDLYDERVEEDKTEKEEEEEEKEGEDEEDEAETNPQSNNEASVYHQQALYETGVDDARGYYDDGAYVAAEEEVVEDDDDDGAATNGHHRDGDTASTDAAFSAAYRARLLAHFADMRAHLAALAVPRAAVGGGGSDADVDPDDDTTADTTVGPLSVRSGVFKHWLHVLRSTDPRPAQVAAMDKVSVLRLLRILQRGLEAGASTSSRSSRAGRFVRSLAGGPGQGQLDMSPRTIRWLWALLARLPDRGELDYREVGYIRDVAKQTVMRLAHLSYDVRGVVERGEEEEDVEEEEEEEPAADVDEAELDAEDIAMDIDSEPEEESHVTGDASTAEATATATAGQDAEIPPADAAADTEADTAADADDADDIDTQQRAALEMVLAVAGEFYGQRDLLARQRRKGRHHVPSEGRQIPAQLTRHRQGWRGIVYEMRRMRRNQAPKSRRSHKVWHGKSRKRRLWCLSGHPGRSRAAGR